MAKMKVYDLAKELGVKSAEILTVLKSRGIEVKSHMSVLEDEQIEEVRKTMKTPEKAAQAPKPAEATKSAAPEKAAQAKAADPAKPAPVKKKKSIIFVSNPDNSRMKGVQIPRKPVHPAEKKAEPAQAPKPANPAKPAPIPVQEAPKPVAEPVKPAPTPVQETPKPAPEVKERLEPVKPAVAVTENRTEIR